MGRNGSMFFKASKMFSFALFTWLGLSVWPLTLYLNSVCHGSRAELQPRWCCYAPSITFYLCVFNCWVCSYPVPLPPFILNFFGLNFACFRCLVSLVLEVSTLPTSLPSHSPTMQLIHLRVHLPAFCGPQYSWCSSLFVSMLPAWLFT